MTIQIDPDNPEDWIKLYRVLADPSKWVTRDAPYEPLYKWQARAIMTAFLAPQPAPNRLPVRRSRPPAGTPDSALAI